MIFAVCTGAKCDLLREVPAALLVGYGMRGEAYGSIAAHMVCY